MLGCWDSFVRVTVRWTLSNVFKSYSKWEFQPDEANSKLGLINVGKTIQAISSDQELNVFFIIPRTLLALEAAELTNSRQVTSDETRTPKSL